LTKLKELNMKVTKYSDNHDMRYVSLEYLILIVGGQPIKRLRKLYIDDDDVTQDKEEKEKQRSILRDEQRMDMKSKKIKSNLAQVSENEEEDDDEDEEGSDNDIDDTFDDLDEFVVPDRPVTCKLFNGRNTFLYLRSQDNEN
jgi:hypothetical protein